MNHKQRLLPLVKRNLLSYNYQDINKIIKEFTNILKSVVTLKKEKILW